MGYSAESGIPFPLRLDPQPLHGPHLYRAATRRVRDFGVKLKLNPVRSLLEGKRVVLIDDSIVRGTTSRKIVRMIRSAGRERGAHADLLSADHLAMFLRRGYAFQE